MKTVNIIGAGLSGLSAAISLSRAGVHVNLISSQPSERAQSVMAEGGINAALDTMGENDSPEEHFMDTMRGGCFLESETAVRNLTGHAPAIVRRLVRLGVPFNSQNGQLILRNFGGQKKKRTAYARSSTGKILMTALIDEVRKYEAEKLVTRYSHHDLAGLEIVRGRLASITVKDNFTGNCRIFTGITILCTGGLNGFFEGMTTGTMTNTGHAAALAFAKGVEFKNLEFIQYHPTTAAIPNKRMLVSEAARGEGGRLFTLKDGKPWYFMEDKYPELGNLMPRDVVSREIFLLKEEKSCSGEVFLDMTGIDKTQWKTRLSDLREEIIDYLHMDPAREPVPVSPGIHFFMGGIGVDDQHRTNIGGLYAAGEAACKYHGANRLGGNSLLAAVFSGRVAGENAAQEAGGSATRQARENAAQEAGGSATRQARENAESQSREAGIRDYRQDTDPDKETALRFVRPESTDRLPDAGLTSSDPRVRDSLRDILLRAMGIVRRKADMEKALTELSGLYEEEGISFLDRARIRLGMAMVRSALERKESRGAHFREDYPDTLEEYKKQSCARYDGNDIMIEFRPPGVEGNRRP